jgi:signal transduction histidine kinase
VPSDRISASGRPISSAAEQHALERIFPGQSEMARRMRALDWSLTELGPPETWPQSLRTAVSICLGSSFPILLWWGPHYIKLYNDAYSTIISDKHPRALGQPGKEVWAEIWDIIGPMLDSAYAGNATRSNDLMLPLERKGYREETYFTFAYSPIANDTGGPGGVFSAIMETTERVLSERRLHNLRELGARAAAARSADEVCARAAETLAENPNDVPFALIYLRDPNGDSAHLAGAVGLDRYPVKAPAAVHRDIQTGFGKGCETPESGLEVALPQSALVLPISVPGQSEAYGFIVGGISPHLQLDADYRGFYQLAARHLAAAISNVRALEAERERTAALAEIDRAKTTFFSNISHEFRTPLTLMLAPTEEALANGTAISGSDLEMVHRNELRLMRLVNTLLDFSRIEAGRVQPRLQAIDLAAYTAELASLFRSALDTADIRLKVDCPPGLEPVAVDPEMWEKIVLNLLSNAFKHTFAGEIEVRLRVENGNATLTVRDTGVGIAPEHLPRIFERFHRIEHARGRTQEGSGIGLALVQELTKLHGGTVAVESKLDQGSTFCVTLPARQRAAVNAAASDVAKSRHADAFLDEALRWSGAAPKDVAVSAGETGLSTTAPSAARARILVADDNADMREYLVRLLNPSYNVIPVADGETALYVARQTLPRPHFDRCDDARPRRPLADTRIAPGTDQDHPGDHALRACGRRSAGGGNPARGRRLPGEAVLRAGALGAGGCASQACDHPRSSCRADPQ